MKQLPWTIGVFLVGAFSLPSLTATELMTFRNSPAISEVISLNDRGMILGRRELMLEAGLLSMESYLRVDGRDGPVPVPDEFTHVEPRVITPSGHVVGFATRPADDPRGNQRAWVWAVTEAVPELLPLPRGFRGSCGLGATRDARRVIGYVLGSDPPRLQPCVWQREESGWSCELLPVIEAYNPLLASAHVKISDQGEVVAASLVTGRSPDGILEYDLFRWQRQPSGEWRRQIVYDQAVHLGDVNDRGMIVGRVLYEGRKRPFVYDPVMGPQLLDLPPGRASGEATDVNRHGQVVGVCEDPPGPEGTTSAFLWYQGQWADLPFGVEVAASTANVITDEGRVGGLLVRVPLIGADSPQPIGEAEAVVESYVLRVKTPAP
jgi:hypothetical protein